MPLHITKKEDITNYLEKPITNANQNSGNQIKLFFKAIEKTNYNGLLVNDSTYHSNYVAVLRYYSIPE